MKKTMFAVLTAILLAVSVNAGFEKINKYDSAFSDVSDTAWYANDVKTAYELGFMNGKNDSKFDPNGNVTVAEGIAMAARLHAVYNGIEVKPRDASKNEYRIDFDDPSIIVDLTKRNQRFDSGIGFNHATGYIEDGVLVVQPDAPNTYGLYDPGVFIKGLDLDTKNIIS